MEVMISLSAWLNIIKVPQKGEVDWKLGRCAKRVMIGSRCTVSSQWGAVSDIRGFAGGRPGG